MARILITGSSDGLGARAANALISRGHSVYVHGRNAQRTQDAERACPGAKGAFSADLSKVEETRKMAEEVNGIGDWDGECSFCFLFRRVGEMAVATESGSLELAPVRLVLVFQ